MVFSWFKKNKITNLPPVQVDMHSHLLPGIDDGVSTLEEALQIVKNFQDLGYRRIITTPHVMSDAYRNTPEIIHAKLEALKIYLRDNNIHIPVSAAAEYYLDESLFKMVETNQPLLTFGEKYLLFETNFITEPFNLKEFIFLATTKGYKLILAHPERYLYLHNNLGKVQDLLDRGVLMQLNISSLTGYYSRPVQSMAYKLVDQKMIHWLGSDCHHLQHTHLLREASTSKYYRKALTLPLLNNTLI
ncbi:MAG: CpsB/CapC family capsule biosynthesis tyrosine phosphatase [Chryseosolibacter sp.]